MMLLTASCSAKLNWNMFASNLFKTSVDNVFAKCCRHWTEDPIGCFVDGVEQQTLTSR